MTINVVGASFATSPSIATALQAVLQAPVVMAGVSGAELREWLRSSKLAAVLRTAGAGDTIVVLELGGNGVPSAETVREADTRLRATGARVVWFVFPSWADADVRANRAATAQVVRANARHVITLPVPPLELLTRDGVHLTAEGYARLGQMIGNRLQGVEGDGFGVGAVLALVSLAAAGYVFWRVVK